MTKIKSIALLLMTLAITGCGGGTSTSNDSSSGIGSNYSSEDIASRNTINIGKNMVQGLCEKQKEFGFPDLIVKEVPTDTTCATYEAINPSTTCLFIDEDEVYAMSNVDGSSLGTLVTCVLAYNS